MSFIREKKYTLLSLAALTTIIGSGLVIWFFSSLERPASNSQLSNAPPLNCTTFPGNDTFNDGMTWVPGGPFSMGADYAYLEEGPIFQTQVAGFWMDTHEVSNAQFSRFVEETGYLTLAERGPNDTSIPLSQQVPGSAVFTPFLEEGRLIDPREGWWHFLEGANWKAPEGPGSTLAGKESHPVVHIAYEDALAYAHWLGRSLPTEAQFEYAAQSSARRDLEGDYQSNTWQGFFPLQDNGSDGFIGSSPVGCFSPNDYGLFDLIGNVWEWTSSPFYDTHDFAYKDDYPLGYDSTQPNEAVAVIKGGSFLCSPNYCMRYRPEARQGQSKGLGTSHIGFRTVRN